MASRRWGLLIGLALIALPAPSHALFDEAAFFAPTPMLDVGFRFQTVDRGTQPDRYFGGVQMLLVKARRGDTDAFWAFANPGLQVQDDGKLLFSFSPVSLVGESGLGAGIQVFPFGSGRAGGVFGLTLGYHWF
jgi:hypothetical protein